MIWESSCGWSFTSTSGNRRNRTVGATWDEIASSSIYASIGGLLLVMIFLVVYYRLPGLIADLAYSSTLADEPLGVTLTLQELPVLSSALAADANVLIFEVTRECKQANLFIVL